MKKLLLSLAVAVSLCQGAEAKNLFINGGEYEVDTIVSRHQVGPGTYYAEYRVPNRPLNFFVTEVDLSCPYINMEVFNGGNAAVATERPTSRWAAEDRPGHDMVAAHNGDFYTTALGQVGISRMGLIGANECIFNPTGTTLLVMDKDRTPYIDYVSFSGSVTAGGKTARIHTVNQLLLEWEPATQANQISLFTPAFGPAMHSDNSGGKVAVLAPVAGSAAFPVNEDLHFTVVSVGDQEGAQAIEADRPVLWGRGTGADYIAALNAGDEVTLRLGVNLPSYPDVKAITDGIGGSNHIILRNGQITNINNPDIHPRTFMGISRDRKTIWAVVADGRVGWSLGIDLDDEGRVLEWLGAYDGINLDGGGSSCMVIDGKQTNHPSDGQERSVGNGVIYYSSAPVDDKPAYIAPAPLYYRVPITATFRPQAYSYNQYGLVLSRDAENITWTCDPAVGTINDDGTFTASPTPATGNLYGTCGSMTCTQPIEVIYSEATLPYSSYIVDDFRPYPIHMQSKIGNFTHTLDPAAVTWTVEDPTVASVTNGAIKALKNGQTTITGTSPIFNGSVNVTVECIPGYDGPVLKDTSLSSITVKQTGGTGAVLSENGNGFNISYTGNAVARNANILLTPATPLKTYALPYALCINLLPGDAPVTSLVLSYADAIGNHGTMTRDISSIDAANNIIFDFDEIIDTKTNVAYPLTFTSLKFAMGTSAKNTQYTISVPSIDYYYNFIGGADDITVAGDSAERAVMSYDLQGRPATESTRGLVISDNGTKTLRR